MNSTCPELLTDSQMARILRVNVRWLRSEAEAGRIPAVKAERRYLFNRDAVERCLASRCDLPAASKKSVFAGLDQAADAIGVPSGFLERIASSGTIPGCYRLGIGDDVALTFDMDQLAAWVRSLDGGGDAK